MHYLPNNLPSTSSPFFQIGVRRDESKPVLNMKPYFSIFHFQIVNAMPKEWCWPITLLISATFVYIILQITEDFRLDEWDKPITFALHTIYTNGFLTNAFYFILNNSSKWKPRPNIYEGKTFHWKSNYSRTYSFKVIRLAIIRQNWKYSSKGNFYFNLHEMVRHYKRKKILMSIWW